MNRTPAKNPRQLAGAHHKAKTSRRNPAISLGPALVANSLCRGQEKRTMRETEVQIGNSGLDIKNYIFSPSCPEMSLPR